MQKCLEQETKREGYDCGNFITAIKQPRETSPTTKIMIHISDGGNPKRVPVSHEMEPRLFKFDALGLSYYPIFMVNLVN